MEKLQILITEAAKKSFFKDLNMNAIPFQQKEIYLIVDNTPKVRMAIQMVKERFGSNSIITKVKSI